LKFFGANPQTQIEEMLSVKLKDFNENVNRPHKSPIFVHKTTPCHVVVHKLEKDSMFILVNVAFDLFLEIHRVYVVDEETKLLGMILNSDILGLFWRNLLIS
jgi:CBS domain-containing protein